MSDKRECDRINDINWSPTAYSGFDRFCIYGLVALIGCLAGWLWGIFFGVFAAIIATLFAFVMMKSTNKIVAAIERERR